MNARALIIFSFLLTFITHLQAQSYHDRLYNAFIQSKMDIWLKIITEMEKEYSNTKNDRLLYDITHAYYGYIGYCISENVHERAIKYIEKGETNLQHLLQKYPKWAEIYALKGAYYGFRMSIAPYKAVYLGPKSIENINIAIQLDKNSPAGYIEKANAEYHMPSVFGGSKQEAIKNYKTAIGIYEKSGKTKTWLYLNTYVNLATVYENLGDFNTSIQIYKKILNIEPDFVYVKNTLLPAALKKSK